MRTIHRAWRGGRGEWRTHFVTALSSSVAFLCLAFALLTVFNLHNLQKRWERVGRLSVYVTGAATSDDVVRLRDALLATPTVSAVEHVTSQQARDQLLETAPTAVLKSLPLDAFPASLEITLIDEHDLSSVASITKRLERLEFVESVETYGVWSERVSRFVGAAILVALVLALVVFLAVVTTVSSSTKLMLERRRAEVEVLRIVGATTAYVRRPFMVEGAVQGALGAGGAVCLAAAAFFSLRTSFAEPMTLFLGAAPRFLPLSVCLALVACGALLGCMAALVSLRRSVLL